MCKCILKRVVFVDETPHGAYKNDALENSGARLHIGTCCFSIRHPVGLIKTMLWRTVVRKCILKTCFHFDETPRGADKNIILENNGAQMYIKTCCLFDETPGG